MFSAVNEVQNWGGIWTKVNFQTTTNLTSLPSANLTGSCLRDIGSLVENKVIVLWLKHPLYSIMQANK